MDDLIGLSKKLSPIVVVGVMVTSIVGSYATDFGSDLLGVDRNNNIMRGISDGVKFAIGWHVINYLE